MKTVHKSVLIWYSAEEMFALVTDVARYPQFLPWCDRASVLSADADTDTDTVMAEVGIAISGIRQSFVTRNVHTAGRKVHLTLVKGPFSQLEGEWAFSPLGEPAPGVPPTAPAPRACRVDLHLNYSFDNAALSALVGPVFDRIAGSLVDAFVKRAEQVYQ
jgi:ribosome-associated toxin RatA of RatAB toxin-antitoxin module